MGIRITNIYNSIHIISFEHDKQRAFKSTSLQLKQLNQLKNQNNQLKLCIIQLNTYFRCLHQNHTPISKCMLHTVPDHVREAGFDTIG